MVTSMYFDLLEMCGLLVQKNRRLPLCKYKHLVTFKLVLAADFSHHSCTHLQELAGSFEHQHVNRHYQRLPMLPVRPQCRSRGASCWPEALCHAVLNCSAFLWHRTQAAVRWSWPRV